MHKTGSINGRLWQTESREISTAFLEAVPSVFHSLYGSLWLPQPTMTRHSFHTDQSQPSPLTLSPQ